MTTPRYLDPDYRKQLVCDPRTGIHIRPHHKDPDGQCAATDRGFFCTVKAGHDGWHVAWQNSQDRSLHIWPVQAEADREDAAWVAAWVMGEPPPVGLGEEDLWRSSF